MIRTVEKDAVGVFFHSKEQARRQFPRHKRWLTPEGDHILDRIDPSAWPEQSPHPVLVVGQDHAAQTKVVIEECLQSGIRGQIGIPSQWWTSFVRTPAGPNKGGMIGFFDDKMDAYIHFFHSRKEARRLVLLQKSLTLEGKRDEIQRISASSLPETSPLETQELTGPIARLINAMQSMRHEQTGTKRL